MQIPSGMIYGTWEVVREVDRVKANRRFECRCARCGTITVKWVSNLLQGKTTCLTCTPRSQINRAGREAVIAARRARSQESDDGRICLTCQTWKSWANFTRDPRRARGKASNCLECAHWRTIRAIYGLTRDEWNWLRQRQDNRCALCAETGVARLAVDHDHSCCPAGRACKKCIRGMLCGTCNRMLGHIDAKPALRARFADYLDGRPFLMP
jgi:hypothetical protein